MEKFNTFDALEGIVLDEEENNEPEILDKSQFRNHSKVNSLTIGYLLGVREDFLKMLEENEEKYRTVIDRASKNNDAVAIRSLNNIRTNFMLYFKDISRSMRVSAVNYTPIYQMDCFKDDFKILTRLGIQIYSPKGDINEYLRMINNEISKRIDGVRPLFPDWVAFKHIRFMFAMPADVEEESKHFQANKYYYPYKRYFHWIYPEDCGNMLLTDERILSIIYSNDGDYFNDAHRVVDVSDSVKNNINEFINRGNKIQIFIDGENIDPYRFASAIYDLQEHEINKIDKIIVYYDLMFSPRAWNMLGHFTSGIEVEAVPVERIKEDKSLVDHKLVAGISKAFYKEGADSFILVSSDSDFWSVIEDVPANYLVMVEKDNCGSEFKKLLRSNDIFYCYIDKFQIPEDDLFFKTVFRKELQAVVNESFAPVKAEGLLRGALRQSYADVSQGVYASLYNNYIKKLKLEIDKDGMLQIVVPE